MNARLVIFVLALTTATGCTGRSGQPPAPLPQPTPVVIVTMSEYRFDRDKPVPSGRVVFRMRNSGQRAHSVTLVSLPDDLPPIADQLKGTERRYLDPFVGIPERRPGTTRSFAVELEPGRRYALICYTIDPDKRNHASKGMSTEFRTPTAPVVGSTPS